MVIDVSKADASLHALEREADLQSDARFPDAGCALHLLYAERGMIRVLGEKSGGLLEPFSFLACQFPVGALEAFSALEGQLSRSAINSSTDLNRLTRPFSMSR